MGIVKSFENYKLVIGLLTVLADNSKGKDPIIDALTAEFGEIDYISPLLDFNFTSYYDEEMGNNIKRFFVSFKTLVKPESLASIKLITNRIEERFILMDSNFNHCRQVNIDPGILNNSRFILATTKDNVHRIPLVDGIYGEVTLIYKKGCFEELPWTYADYKSDEYKKILLKIRETYKEDLKNLKQR